MNNRIGVYICHCGDNIAAYVDIEKLKIEVTGVKGVVMVKDTMFACAGSTQQEIVEDIRRERLNGMVVASCSPKLHLYTFRDVARRGGLNPYLYVQANIREQGSWAHSDKPDKATEKAIRVVKAAIARARLAQALLNQKISSENTALVVGAGIGGMKAAIELAEMGSRVVLIEKSHAVGGRISQWGELFPTDQEAETIIQALYRQIQENESITLMTGTEIAATSGSVGNFEITLRTRPRFIRAPEAGAEEDEFRREIDQAIAVCPEEAADPFDYGQTRRKAISWNHTAQYPRLPAIDEEVCSRCGKCEPLCRAIDLSQKNRSLKLKAGAVVLCTGFDTYQPQKGEFGYADLKQVITLPELRRILASSKGPKLVVNEREIRSIAYIYCVGSRQPEGGNKFCSRYCCTTALHTSQLVKRRYPYIQNYHFHRGIRSYGKNETLYTGALDQGDLFIQSGDDELPEVQSEGENCLIKTDDILSGSMEIGVQADLVVLVTAMVPRRNSSLVEILKVPVGRNGFFNEVHPKLKPVETVIDGIFIAGAGHFPKTLEETLYSAMSASVKANGLIGSGEIELEPNLAIVNPDTCEWCGKCHQVCPFDAIREERSKNKKIAVVQEANCKGCGMCLPVCPSNSIQLIGFTDEEMEAMIGAMI